jgi:SAM-dependent methyltransferase
MPSSRPLRDAPDRSYASKLERFARFIAPELATILEDLKIPPSARVLDVGCGVGHATNLLSGTLEAGACVVGMDLSLPHLERARSARVSVVQADASQPCFRDATFDLVWSCNTLNHVADPVATLRALRAALRPGGRLVLAQSHFLSEMFFAWDARLDEAVRRACHEYYRERYGLAASDTAGIRNLVGLLRSAGFEVGRVRTYPIERTQPLGAADRDFFAETVFVGYWGEKLRPWLSGDEWAALQRNIAPASPDYCLDRPDFHHIQTLTVCVGHG